MQLLELKAVVFSKQESLCIQHLCQGLTYKEIGKMLSISPKTIETYIARAKIKINCKTRTELMVTFIKNQQYLSGT